VTGGWRKLYNYTIRRMSPVVRTERMRCAEYVTRMGWRKICTEFFRKTYRGDTAWETLA